MGVPEVPQGGDSDSLLTPNHPIIPIVQVRKQRLREGAGWGPGVRRVSRTWLGTPPSPMALQPDTWWEPDSLSQSQKYHL